MRVIMTTLKYAGIVLFSTIGATIVATSSVYVYETFGLGWFIGMLVSIAFIIYKCLLRLTKQQTTKL